MQNTFDAWEGIFLQHHGIKGQKWGVRRFRNSDGSLTPAGLKRYNRQLRKLNRLDKRTDISLQKHNAEKYKERAKKSGKVAAALGAGAVASYVGDLIGHKRLADSSLIDFYGHKDAQRSYEKIMRDSEGFAQRWNSEVSARQHGSLADQAYDSYGSHLSKSKPFATGSSSTHTKALAGAAAVAGGYAAYNAIRSKVAKNRTTEKGHKKAVEKYKKQYKKMINQFGDTPYSELVRRQRKNVQ